jgi:nitrate/TMAO reductase-like tetraheme cytochrome c subunit
MKQNPTGARRIVAVVCGLTLASGALLLGALALDSAFGVTTDDAFCLSCHEMAANIGGEFEPSLWLPGSEERHASCAECHLPQQVGPRMWRKLRAARELYHHLIGTLGTPERFEARRLAMARVVWEDLHSNRSGECTGCHEGNGEADRALSDAARAYHERAELTGLACIGCHKGVAHAIRLPAPTEGLHAEAEDCHECHEPEWIEAIWGASHSNSAGKVHALRAERCADCHTGGSTHLQLPLPRSRSLAAGATKAEEAKRRTCLECHRQGPRVDWEVRAHGFADAPCDGCHRIHPDPRGEPSKGTAGASCTQNCHVWVGEKSAPMAGTATSVSEEKGCVDCHNPHLPPETSRCQSCHAMDEKALAEQTAEARSLHKRGQRERIDCGACHKGIIHRIPHAVLMSDGATVPGSIRPSGAEPGRTSPPARSTRSLARRTQ